MIWFKLLFIFLPLLSCASTDDGRCLTDYPEVNPKKYIHYEGRSLDIIIETSERVIHQLSTWVFYYFLKEVLGYSKLKIVRKPDNFQIEKVIERLTDTSSTIPETIINLEVWIPPDYDTYVTEFVKECGSVSPPGRFGWFIPINLTQPIKRFYNPKDATDIRSIHWRYFREKEFVQYFVIPQDILDQIIEENGYLKLDSGVKGYACPQPNCTKSMYIPLQCTTGQCAVLLSSYWNSTSFVVNHIEENKLLVKVLFLGSNLNRAITEIIRIYKTKREKEKSLVVLSWTPSDVILFEQNYVTVSFENCERFRFTHNNNVGYKYEMHRLVKVTWSKVEKFAKPLYDGLRSFKFEEVDFNHLLSLYEKNRKSALSKVACEWMKSSINTWIKWKQSTETVIHIGGIFPMSRSSYSGKGILKAGQMAISAINNNKTILSDYTLKMIATDGMCSADNVMKNFIDFIVNQEYYNSLVGVLGPACSDTVEPLAGVSRHYRIAVISYSAEGSSFSNREKYPYFFRTIGENHHYKHVYLKLCKHFKWSRVAALTEDGQKYTEYISLMQDDLEKNNITFIANKKFPRERETEPMTRYLEDLKNKRARIIIADVIDEVARQVMCEAYKLNMTAVEGYVWFLPMSLHDTWYNTDYFNTHKNESVNCTTANMIQAITGYFSLTHAYFAPENQTMQENKTVGQWIKEYESFANNTVSNYGGFAYDAVWVYALALDNLSKTDPEALSDIHSENTTNKLVNLIQKTDFFGVSGRIKFRGGPSRFSVITIFEWYSNTSHLVGEFYPSLTDDMPEILGGRLTLNMSKIKWFTSDGMVPDDGRPPPPVCAIESIAKAFNVECQTAVIILNVMIAILLGLTVMGVCLYLKYNYDKKVQKQKEYMERLGLRYERKYPSDLEELEVPREHMELNRRLGEGAFGTVYGGEAEVPVYGWSPVAVKTLKSGSSTEDKIDFLTEADNMKRFDHKNIVKLLGVVTKTQPLHTLMEFCLYGDLKTYLLARRHLANKNIEGSEEVSPKRLTNMALDIARGLSYLAEMKYVHRDLACRNCLINAQRVVKIGDFGMTRPMNDYECYRFTRKGMLPVRWMASESLVSGIFTTSSDIWSFGVVLYEIVTFGCTPWYGKANTEVVDLVKKGSCLEVPRGVKAQLEALMKSCWAQDPKVRPQASGIVEYLANNPRLLSACTDVPLQSLTFDDFGDGKSEFERGLRRSKIDMRKSSTSSNFNSPKTFIRPNQSGEESAAIAPLCTDEDLSVNIQLESYCPKIPLLGSSKSINNLIYFGKLNRQNSERDLGCQDENEGFNANSSSNGYINSKL